jgi:hypothetical protein
MATPPESSDHAHSTSRPSGSGERTRFAVMFSPDRLSSLRGVISVLLDLGRLIDRALAMWHHYGIPVVRHS